MKNFRKVLALVLVVAVLFSFVAIANAATPSQIKDWLDDDYVEEMDREYYTDDEDIDYVEAVRVLTYVGILNGYPEGDDTFSFQPANNIRRNEMAKMIAVLANAGYDVDELYATAADFEDVPADDWAASYVAYCAKTGIVAGRSATTFDPNASVTGLETAKMLLVVLGMDAEQQGYVGADWKVNVLRDAKVMGLLENFDAAYNIDAAISRDEAANMMLNALKAPCVVGFLSDDVITVTNTLVFGDYDRDDFEYNYTRVGNYATLRDAAEAENWALFGNVVISDDLLADVLFDLKTTTGHDCFGRPGTLWTMVNNRKAVDVVFAAIDADFAEYDTSVEEVMEYLDETTKGEFNYNLWIDGDLTEYDEDYMGLYNQLHDDDVLGKGVVVEIYEHDDEIDVVVINTYIDKITAVNMAKGTVTLGGETVKNEWGFNASDVDETVVLFWECADGIHNVEVIEPETATLTRANIDGKGNKSFIASGETYEYAHTFGIYLGGYEWDDMMSFDDDGLRDWDIYTDMNGFVMYVERVDHTEAEFVVIDGDSWISEDPYMTADGMEFKVNTCDFVYFEEDAPVKTVDTTAMFNNAFVGADDLDGIENNDVLAWVITDEVEDEMYLVAADVADGNTEIALKRGAVEIDTTDADLKNIKVNADTQFIVRVPDYFGENDDDFTYLYFDGMNDIDANYVAEDFQYFVDNDEDVELDGSGRFYAYIYVDAVYAKETNRAFILNHYMSSVLKLDNGRTMGGDIFEAIVNGEEALVVYDRGYDVISNLMADGPVMVKSDLVLIGWTLDDMPVWANPGVSDSSDGRIEAADEPEFRIDGEVLTWRGTGSTTTTDQYLAKKCDPDVSIWVAEPNKKGEFEAKELSADELVNYSSSLGYKYIAGWAIDALDETNRTDGLVDYLLLVVTEA